MKVTLVFQHRSKLINMHYISECDAKKSDISYNTNAKGGIYKK